jgi:uncharacterized protein (TIGR02597 family)
MNKAIVTLGLCLPLVLKSSFAQEVAATPAAGYFTLEARGGRDTPLSLPLAKRSAYLGRVSAVTASTLRLTQANWAIDTFAPSSAGAYYAHFVTGNLAGLYCKIVTNTADTLELDMGSASLLSHSLGAVQTGAAGDVVRIRPAWTVAEVFGASDAELRLTSVSSAESKIYLEGDAVLLPDNLGLGTEKPPLQRLAYVANTGWRPLGEPTIDAAAITLAPAVPFIVRRQAEASATLTVVGYTLTEPIAVKTPALPANQTNDTLVALAYPHNYPLSDSTLNGVTAAAVDYDHAEDFLLVLDRARAGFSLPPAARFFRNAEGWLQGETAANDYALLAGYGYVIRVRGERSEHYWIQRPPQ